MVNLNDKKFMWTVIAGTLAVSGMLIKNGYDSLKFKVPFNANTYKVGDTLKAFGLFLAALSIATKDRSASIFDLELSGHGALVMFAVGLIVVFGRQLEQYQTCDFSRDSKCPQHVIAGFSGGWALLALALAAQSKFAWLNTLLGFGSALMILCSKLGVLPYQRIQKQTDGPGYAMLVAGWFGLAVANSL